MEKVFLGVLAGATNPQVIRAVRGVLDFIYYAHFETHTDQSLAELDAAWLMFHKNKAVFEDLEICDHFNINKLHNIKHYVDSIRSRGTADGFNTEGTERLHIDLAKVGYLAGNKKDYIKQMTTWLRRQEAIQRHCVYLQWAVPGYTAEIVNAAEDAMDETDKETGADDNEADEAVVDVVQDKMTTYIVAKKPAIVGASDQSLTDQHDAPHFVHHLNTFLANSLPGSNAIASDSTRFSLYKQLVLKMPAVRAVSSQIIHDVVHASPGVPQRITVKGIQQAKPAKLSTVLVRIRATDHRKGPLDGICAAQVKVIFKLPEEFGAYPCPLAYVSWYKPFHARPVPDIEMFSVSESSRNHHRHASIIPITDILHTCHLIPHFGSASASDLGWTASMVLNEAPSFYLNPYLRHMDFFLLRHTVNLHAAKQREKENVLERARVQGIRPSKPYTYRSSRH